MLSFERVTIVVKLIFSLTSNNLNQLPTQRKYMRLEFHHHSGQRQKGHKIIFEKRL